MGTQLQPVLSASRAGMFSFVFSLSSTSLCTSILQFVSLAAAAAKGAPAVTSSASSPGGPKLPDRIISFQCGPYGNNCSKVSLLPFVEPFCSSSDFLWRAAGDLSISPRAIFLERRERNPYPVWFMYTKLTHLSSNAQFKLPPPPRCSYIPR